MTITALSKQLNVSTMTIYRRCKKHGVKLDGLRDDVTGELTSDGVAVIAAMFDATRPEQALTDDATDCNGAAQTTSQGLLDASTAILQAKLDGANALIEQLQGERDRLVQQVESLQAALAAEIQDRQAERRLLSTSTGSALDREGEPARRHWWEIWRR